MTEPFNDDGAPAAVTGTPLIRKAFRTAMDDVSEADTLSSSSSGSESDGISSYQGSSIPDDEVPNLDDTSLIPRSHRLFVFVLMVVTQLIANFDSGALASIYGMKPDGPNVQCSGTESWACPGTEADGTTFPPTETSPGVTAYLAAEAALNSTPATWACSQSANVATCSSGTATWSCDRVVGDYNTAVTTGNYTCVYSVGDSLSQSLLHDPNFNNLYQNKNLQGFLSSIVYLGISLGAVITGVALRFFKAQRVLQLSLAGNVGFCVFFAFSFNRASLFASRFLVGVTQATLLVYAPVWVSEFALPEYASLWMSLIQAAVPLGIVMGYLTAGFIASATTLEWPWSFYIQSIALGPCMLANFFVPSYLMNVGEPPPGSETPEDAAAKDGADGKQETDPLKGACTPSEIELSAPAKMAMPPIRNMPVGSAPPPMAPGTSTNTIVTDPLATDRGLHKASSKRSIRRTESRRAGHSARREGTGLGQRGDSRRKRPGSAFDDTQPLDSAMGKRTPSVRGSGGPAAAKPKDADNTSDTAEEPVSEFAAFKAVATNPIVWLGIATTTSLYFVVTAMQLWITDYLTTEPAPVNIPGATADDRYTTIVLSFGITAITAPITGVLIGGFILDSPRFVGGVTDHPNKAAFFSTCAGVCATAAAFGALIVTEFWPFIICIWFTLAFGGMVLPGFIGVIFAAVPVELRDITSSLAGLMWNLFGYFAGPWLTGVVADQASLKWGFRLAIGWAAVAAFFGVLTWIVGVRRKLARGGPAQDVYCMPIARCLGYRVEEEAEMEKDMEVCGLVEKDGVFSVVCLPKSAVDLPPLVKLMLLLAEYAEDDVLLSVATLEGQNSIISRKSTRSAVKSKAQELVATPDAVPTDGEAELLYEIFSLIDWDQDGSVNRDDIEDFLRDHKNLAAKLRGCPDLKDLESVVTMADKMHSMLSKDARNPAALTWGDFVGNGKPLLGLLKKWRTMRLRQYFILAGFANRSDKHIVLKRASRKGLPYYWGPADPKNPQQTKDKAQIFLYTVRRRNRRMWTIGTPKDFATRMSGYFYADATNRYGLLTSPQRQTVWRFVNRLAEEHKWGSTLRITTQDLWEVEAGTYEKDDRRLLGQPAGALGIAAFGVSVLGPLTARLALPKQQVDNPSTAERSGHRVDMPTHREPVSPISPMPFRRQQDMSDRHLGVGRSNHPDTYRRMDTARKLDTFRRLDTGRRLDTFRKDTHRKFGDTYAPPHLEYVQDGLVMLTPAALLKKLRRALQDNAVTVKHTDQELLSMLDIDQDGWMSVRREHRGSGPSGAYLRREEDSIMSPHKGILRKRSYNATPNQGPSAAPAVSPGPRFLPLPNLDAIPPAESMSLRTTDQSATPTQPPIQRGHSDVRPTSATLTSVNNSSFGGGFDRTQPAQADHPIITVQSEDDIPTA